MAVKAYIAGYFSIFLVMGLFEAQLSEYYELKLKSSYLKALYEVRDLLQNGYDKTKLLEWLEEKISSLQEEIAEEISGY